ncbi:MAG: efflux RND transporter periplasmic adaptor subunit [Bacteroidota bacterium]
MKKILLLLIPLLGAALLVTAYNLNKTATESEKVRNLRQVETQLAEAIEYQPSVFASGKLAAREEIRLSFKTGGIIRRLYVREGQKVKKGQLLAELKLDEINAQVQQAELGNKQAEIAIRNAELALQKAERDYENTQGLYQDSVATFEQLDNARIQLDNARNQLEAAQTGLDFNKKNTAIADFNLTYSKITAPAAGTVLRKMAEANELVGPGSPIFLLGTKNQELVIRVNITDKDIIHLRMGDKADIEFDAYPNHQFKGEIREMASIADAYTGTYEVEISVDSEGKKLLPGFIGKVNIHTSEQESLVRIPIDALISADKNRGVIFTVKGDSAIRTLIDIHKLEKGSILLRKGLQPGEELVVKGGGYLQQGDLVSRQNSSNPALSNSQNAN